MLEEIKKFFSGKSQEEKIYELQEHALEIGFEIVELRAHLQDAYASLGKDFVPKDRSEVTAGFIHGIKILKPLDNQKCFDKGAFIDNEE